jgi:hypothetical protein
LENQTLALETPRAGPRRAEAEGPTLTVFVSALGAHALLGLAMTRSLLLAQFHFYTVAGVGVLLALSGRRVRGVLYVVAYAVASEVLWRRTDGAPFYEGAKYLAAGLMLLSLTRFPGRVRLKILPVLFFILFLPSLTVTLSTMPLNQAIDQTSFYLSGLFILAVGAWYFQHFSLGPREIRGISFALLAPIVAMGAIAANSTMSAADIYFQQESNYVTSGGFGPNQVSSMLGMGALISFLLALDRNSPRVRRMGMMALGVALATQCALTFSRGGLMTAFGAGLVALLFQFRDRRSRVRIIVSAGVVYAMVSLLILPRLDAFTGGAIVARFQDVDLGTRGRFMGIEMEAWRENPVLGLGPGGTRDARLEATGVASAAHTEVTRILGEHGAFGFGAIVVFALMTFQFVRRQRTVDGRAWAASLVAFTALFTMHSALRIAIPGFAVALAAARLDPYGPARDGRAGGARSPSSPDRGERS